MIMAEIRDLDKMLSDVIFEITNVYGKNSNSLALRETMNTLRTYQSSLREAMARGDRDSQKKAACRISGMRKGVSNLSFLHQAQHRSLIDKISDADDLSTIICLH